MKNVVAMNPTTATVVYLDEQYRTPGMDHLDQYRDSCFYPLLNKSVKERGSAYEEICAKILRAIGKNAIVAPSSYGAYDLVVDGQKIELKTSRKASQYDTRGRSYQFSYIREETGYDAIYLMKLMPCNTVEIYEASFEELKPHLKPTDRKRSSWNLSADPADLHLNLVASIEMQQQGTIIGGQRYDALIPRLQRPFYCYPSLTLIGVRRRICTTII